MKPGNARPKFVKLSASLFVAVLAGCASGPTADGPRFTQLETVSPGGALVYFYRPGEEAWNIKGRKFHIYVNGNKAGVLPFGGYFTHAVPAGKAVILADSGSGNPAIGLPYVVEQATRKPGRIEFEAPAGTVLFVRLRATDEFWNIAGNLSLESKEAAVRELEKTKLVR
jgi:hypothetical protein